MRVNRGHPPSLVFGALAWRFFQPQLWDESALSQTLRRKTASDWLTGPECTPANESIQFFCYGNCGGISPPRLRNCGVAATVKVRRAQFSCRHVCCSYCARTFYEERDWARHF